MSLRTQGAELGVAREDPQLELLMFGAPRRLERECDVVHREHEQVEDDGDREQKRLWERPTAAASCSPGVARSTAIHSSAISTHMAPPETQRRPTPLATAGARLDVSGIARETYQADRQTNA